MLDTGGLDQINTLPKLLDYLRENCEWPIEEENFENLVFDWDPRELGLKEAEDYRNIEIKQLRPLTSNQPWGIFFVNFPKKDLKVTILRRILGALTVKRRKSANAGERAAWQKHDLLFLSAYGESGHRQLTFAHFQDDPDDRVPRLDVLGWNQGNTIRRLSEIRHRLTDNLRWPADPKKVDEWRTRWSSAFDERPKEAITTSKQLASALAALAKEVRDRAISLLDEETDTGPLTKLYKAFKEALIHDLTPHRFADMYAQTITYGLLATTFRRTSGAVTADSVSMMALPTNPFLADTLKDFLQAGGRKGGMDFDELGVNDVVEMLRRANMEAVLRDFDDRNPEQDPVIHFYESFLKEYDPEERIQRGVFYTPRPVVSFIVRSVDEVLRRDFKLDDGLADTATWGEMEKRLPGVKRPKGVETDEPFVRVLDPATGTGTFLVEIIDLIHNRMAKKWASAGKSKAEIEKLWNDYVPRHLLPRLYAFELMMAPYAIAHMKVGLKLFDTGYKFGSQERARIFLANALEAPKDLDMQLAFMSDALAHEAKAANEAKGAKFTAVIGNPPYSKLSGNLSPDAVNLVAPFRLLDGVRIKEKGALAFELALQDDYVKFYGLLHRVATNSGVIVASLITNFGYLNSKYLRGMRRIFMEEMDNIAVLNLGGRIADRNTEQRQDDNVFEIEQGVAIGEFVRVPKHQPAKTVDYFRLWGTQSDKFDLLGAQTMSSLDHSTFNPNAPLYRYEPLQGSESDEFNAWPALDEILVSNSGAIITSRDGLAIGWDKPSLISKIKRFSESRKGDTSLQRELDFSIKKKWDAEATKKELRAEGVSARFAKPLYYRPFDTRFIYYFIPLLDTPSRPISEMLYRQDNVVLLTPGIKTTDKFCHVLVSRWPAEKKACSHDRATQMFPLFIRDESHLDRVVCNFNEGAIRPLVETLGLERADATRRGRTILSYIYAVLHSPSYRSIFGGQLKQGFPRVPIEVRGDLARELVTLGDRLVELHLFDPQSTGESEIRFAGRGTASVEKSFPKWSNGRVAINAERWFEEVPENVWSFHIGGYPVCEKWLKDRRIDKLGRALNESEILHYRRIVTAISETIDLMAEIDRVIDRHGGWPGAFKGMTD